MKRDGGGTRGLIGMDGVNGGGLLEASLKVGLGGEMRGFGGGGLVCTGGGTWWGGVKMINKVGLV